MGLMDNHLEERVQHASALSQRLMGEIELYRLEHGNSAATMFEILLALSALHSLLVNERERP